MTLMNKKLLVLFVIIQIIMQSTIVDCKQQQKKGNGNGKVVAGVLAGGIAGAALGHILTNQMKPAEHHHHIYYNTGVAMPIPVPASAPAPALAPAPAPPVRPPTYIEKGETLPNGCYKQTIKEPDVNDITRFIETEQLICPPSVPAQSVVPIQAAPPIAVPYPVVPEHPQPQPQPAPEQPKINVPIVPENLQPQPQPIPELPNIQDPSQFPSLVYKPPPVKPIESSNPVAPEQPQSQPIPQAPPMPVPQLHYPAVAPSAVEPVVAQPQSSIVYVQQPAAPADVPAPTSATSQVIILSKKSGFYADINKKNHANSMLTTNYVVMLFFIVFVYLV